MLTEINRQKKNVADVAKVNLFLHSCARLCQQVRVYMSEMVATSPLISHLPCAPRKKGKLYGGAAPHNNNIYTYNILYGNNII